MKMRALSSKTHFHVFFNSIFEISKNTHKKHVDFWFSQKRIEKNVKSEIPTCIKNKQVFYLRKPSLHMKGAHYMPYMVFSESWKMKIIKRNLPTWKACRKKLKFNIHIWISWISWINQPISKQKIEIKPRK